MKTKYKIQVGAYVLIAASIFAFSCKKKEIVPENSASSAKGTLMVHLHTNVDQNEVNDCDSVYVMSGGRKISVSIAQLYISGIQLVKTDGSVLDLAGINILKTMEEEKYSLGDVPSGNYKSIRFNVGLASGTNTVAPSAGDSTLNRSSMWFDNAMTSSGHVFVNFQGKIDTSEAANNSVAQMQSFVCRLGTTAHVKSVLMPDRNYSILPNQTQYIHLTIDYNKLFTGVVLNVKSNLDISTVADNTSTQANQIANNIPWMFSYQ